MLINLSKSWRKLSSSQQKSDQKVDHKISYQPNSTHIYESIPLHAHTQTLDSQYNTHTYSSCQLSSNDKNLLRKTTTNHENLLHQRL